MAEQNPPAAGDLLERAGGAEVRLVVPLIGIESADRFRLVPLSGRSRHLARLVPLEGDGPSFVLARSDELDSSYHLELDEAHRRLLEARSACDLVSWSLLAGGCGGAPTANLLAPLVVNPERGLAMQVVLEESGYPSALALT